MTEPTPGEFRLSADGLAIDIFDETGLLARPAVDRKLEHEFRATRPVKDLPCVFQGCTHRFRVSTQYSDFLAHWKGRHCEGVGS